MKFIISGQDYPLEESIQGAALGDLLALKLQTKTEDFKGVTVSSIQKMFVTLGEQVSQPDFNFLDVLGDEDFLRNIVGLVFLARRKSGEQLTYEVASRISFTDIQLATEPEPEEDAPKDEAAASTDPSA
jgi:hypothetical protein